MTSNCAKCGGLVVAVEVLDFYQTNDRKCVNCGWYCRESPQRNHSRTNSVVRGGYK